MHIVKPALTLAILMTSLVCTNAWAQQAPPAPVAAETASPDKTGDKKPPVPPKKPPVKRRAVHQIIDGMPTPAAPPSYGPVLTAPPGAAQAGPGMLPSTIPPSMAPPATMNRCDAGGCTDSSGARYNGASGTLLSPQGRLCSTSGVVVNCI